jgi:HK97 gp10 family phage protein
MVQVHMEGGEELRRELQNPQFVRGPVHDFLHRIGLAVEGRAKANAPVDTGRLRGSIATTVDEGRLEARVGSNVNYAPFVEFGTRPHFPPLSAVQPWARRHGFPLGRAGAFLVARAISRRGTRAQPFLIPALHNSKRDVERFTRIIVDGMRNRLRRAR